MRQKRRAVAIVSGRMDSVTLAHLMASEGYELHLLSADYGQRHVKEIDYAERCAERRGAVCRTARGELRRRRRRGSTLRAVCGTCTERKEAFSLAGVPNPTEYRA